MSQVELKNINELRSEKGRDNPAFNTDGTHAVVSPMDSSPPPYASKLSHGDDLPRHREANHAEQGEDGLQPPNSRSINNDDDDDDDKDLNACARGINSVQQGVVNFFVTNKRVILSVFLIVLLLLYFAYFVYALVYRFGDEGSIRLLWVTLLAVLILVLRLTWKYISQGLQSAKPDLTPSSVRKIRTTIRWTLYVVSLATMITLLIVLVALKTPDNLVSLGGLAAFIFLAWITSTNPAKVNWHPVFWGFSLQFYFATIILRTRAGYDAFKWLGDRVTEFLAYSDEGAAFVFGTNFRVHFFAFSILPVIVFFSSIISVLYYLGVMQAIIAVLGRFLAFCLGTTPAESINAAGNIFVGMTEAPLMIRPFLVKMTKSEIHAVMTGGFATIAGSVLGAYIGFGVPANHLLSASVMSAPAALAISKLTYPETEKPHVGRDDYAELEKGSERNIIEAASGGASSAIVIVANVAVNVIAFLSILKFVNATLTWFGDRAGVENLTFQLICSYVLYPVALFMGTELGTDCRRVGELIGIKTFTNEFIAYESLKELLENRLVYKNYSLIYDINDSNNIIYDGLDVNLTQWNRVLVKGFLSPRSEVIATYALCGFSNFGSMGVLLGGLTALAPSRKQDMAAIVFRAMIAGNVACFFTACIAGLFYEDFE